MKERTTLANAPGPEMDALRASSERLRGNEEAKRAVFARLWDEEHAGSITDG